MTHARAPAATLAIAIGAGIGLDRSLDLPLSFWMAGTLFVFMTALAWRGPRRSMVRAALVCGLFAGLGGLRHHGVWSLRGPDDITRIATEQPQLVELIGVVAAPVEITTAKQDAFTPEWMRWDRSVCQLRAISLATHEAQQTVSGLVRVEVTGDLVHVRPGDRVRVMGTLAAPSPPRNPGAFDFRRWLRDRRIDTTLRADHPDAVRKLPASERLSPGFRFARLRDQLRHECRALLVKHLQPRHVPVAASLLLGDRTGMLDEVSDAFVESGTMHLLAISGLHVSMLAAMLFILSRGLNASTAATAIFVLTGIAVYAFVTDQRPPVLRAAIISTIVVAAGPGLRPISALNSLGLSAIVVLLWNPADLFDVGAQLSFLAVLGIIAGSRLARGVRLRRDPLAEAETPLLRFARRTGVRLLQIYIVTAAIWLFTLPLTIDCFHLAAPIGLALNVLLIPYSALLLGAGFALLLTGLLLPAAAPLPGFVFDFLMQWLLMAVEWSASTPLGHFYIPGPPRWWLFGWYAVLAVGCGLVRLPISPRWVWRSGAAWWAIGLCCLLSPAPRTGLTCTVLSVGHGGAITLELPGGRTLVYDAGTFGAPERAQRAVQSALWESGVDHIDALILSHADSDHYNGIPGLLRTIPIGSILLSQTALDFRQEAVAAMCESAARRGVPLRLVFQGDKLLADDDVAIEILHPPPGERHDADNANSLVVRVRYAGRSILLTGDLEGPGLASLLRRPPGSDAPEVPPRVDVLLAPHHGSSAANPAELAAWARPRHVILSTGNRGRAAALQSVYGESCRVVSTAESGAVRVHISPDGTLHVESFLER